MDVKITRLILAVSDRLLLHSVHFSPLTLVAYRKQDDLAEQESMEILCRVV